MGTHILHRLFFSAPVHEEDIMGLLCFSFRFIGGKPVAHAGSSDFLFRVVPVLSARFSVPHHMRRLPLPQSMLPWIMSQVWVNYVFAVGEI